MPKSANFAFWAAYYNWPHPHRCSHTCECIHTSSILIPCTSIAGLARPQRPPSVRGACSAAGALVRCTGRLGLGEGCHSEWVRLVPACVGVGGEEGGLGEGRHSEWGCEWSLCGGTGRTHLQIQMLIQILSLSCIVTFRCMTPTLTSRSGPSAGTRPSPAARSAPAAAADCQLLCRQQQQQREPDCLPRHLRDVFRCCLVTTAASSSAGRTVSRWGGKGLGWK